MSKVIINSYEEFAALLGKSVDVHPQSMITFRAFEHPFRIVKLANNERFRITQRFLFVIRDSKLFTAK